MSAWKITGMFLLAGLVVTSVASARPAMGPAKARGDYRGFSSSWRSPCYGYGRSYRTYAPAVRSTPAPAVAEAPAESRRFSYDPSVQAESSAVDSAAPVDSVPQAIEGGEQFDSSSMRPRSYRAFSGGSSRAAKPAWALPKTDPRKYRVGR